MISKDNFSAEHIRELQLHNHRDPLLLERTLFAFGLLEALVKVGMKFTFKQRNSPVITALGHKYSVCQSAGQVPSV